MSAVTALIGRFKQGSSSAFADLFDRFFPHTVRLASARSAVSAHDEEDVAQCVFWQLFREVRGGRPLAERLSNTTTLLTTLALLTRQQLRRNWRDSTRKSRDIRLTWRASDLQTHDLTPDHAATHWLRQIQSRESIEELFALLPDDRYRKTVELLLNGLSLPEIALELGRSLRAVQRYVAEIRALWQDHTQRGGDADHPDAS